MLPQQLMFEKPASRLQHGLGWAKIMGKLAA
jgi:hypothetical protein